MGRARIVVHAGIDALRVDARVVTRTVTITVAADHATPVERIAVVTFATDAVSHVIVRLAFGVGATWIRDQARVHTVVVHASFIESTLTIMLTFHRVARDFGITLVTLFARTDRFVISYIAISIAATIAGVATLPIDAGFVVTAIVIRRARSDHRQLYCRIRMIYELRMYPKMCAHKILCRNDSFINV